MHGWTDVYSREKSFTCSEWADYHATGLTHVVDPWWDVSGMWDPPFATYTPDEISAWVEDFEMEIISILPFDDGGSAPDSDEWCDRFYLAIARTLGADAAESVFFWRP